MHSSFVSDQREVGKRAVRKRKVKQRGEMERASR